LRTDRGGGTGGYETLLVAALHAGGLPVVLVNPRWAHAFAKAIGQLAKTIGSMRASGAVCRARRA